MRLRDVANGSGNERRVDPQSIADKDVRLGYYDEACSQRAYLFKVYGPLSPLRRRP